MVALNDGVRMSETAVSVADMQHNVRSGLNQMTRDLIQTGQGIPLGGIPMPSGAGITPVVRPGPGGMTFAADAVAIPALNPGPGLGALVGTDIVTLLYADQRLALDEFALDGIAADGSTGRR